MSESKYTKDEQVLIVQQAMNLQATIESEQAQIKTIQNQTFRLQPAEPKHEVATPVSVNYPAAPKSSYSFSDHIKNDNSFLGKLFSKTGLIISVVVSIFTFGFGFIVLGILFLVKYFEYLEKRNEFNKQLANTPEYLKAKEEAEKLAKDEQETKQQQLDESYSTAMVKYNQELEQYNDELADWETKKSIKLSILQDDLQANKEALSELYDSTMLIPKHNRALNQLVWLYDDMSSSQHDFEQSLDCLYKDRQIAESEQINKQMGDMTNMMYQGFSATLEAIDYGNSELDEIRGTLGKVRRDMNIANVGAAVQRRNLKKEVKATNSKLNEVFDKK